jgi:hypothetical protein
VLLDINLVWFGYIARLYQWGKEGGGGHFTRSNDFYLPLLYAEEGGGGQHPVVPIRTKLDFFMITYIPSCKSRYLEKLLARFFEFI